MQALAPLLPLGGSAQADAHPSLVLDPPELFSVQLKSNLLRAPQLDEAQPCGRRCPGLGLPLGFGPTGSQLQKEMALVLLAMLCLLGANPCQPILETEVRWKVHVACSVQPDCPHPLSCMVLKCLVKGYRDECASDQTQPSRAELSVEISWLARRRLVQEGDSFTLRCQTVGQRPVLRYIWAHGNEWLQEAGQELHIPHAGVTDGGCFSCSVWVSGPNSGLLVSTRKSITVHYVPKGVHIMATLRTNVMEQETGALTCNYSSSVPSSVTYTRYKDHVVLNETRQKLELEDRGAEDAGEYWCEVKNEVGASQSSSFTIQGKHLNWQ
ncbi:hypothetical protein Y1Q_0018592 [Alligator mississippiensis]|uniref:Ig-like domain-containing protein n=1 Tax=Alligator mississippiensis TaxID=8496 RepID=A0A151NCC4_ALLMI|nr:hypothetical protein Y1Q_0018592 [Alligator mississippiensis]